MEKEKVFDSHCAYFAQSLQKKEKLLFGPSQHRVLEEMVGEMGNIREGWKRAVYKTREKDMEQYLDGLFGISDTKGWFQEAQETFQKAAEALREKYGRSKPPAKSTALLARILARWAAFENDLGRTSRNGEEAAGGKPSELRRSPPPP